MIKPEFQDIIQKLGTINRRLFEDGLKKAEQSDFRQHAIWEHKYRDIGTQIRNLAGDISGYESGHNDLENLRYLNDLKVNDRLYVITSGEGLYNHSPMVAEALFHTQEPDYIQLKVINQFGEYEPAKYGRDKFGKLVFADEETAEIVLETLPMPGYPLYKLEDNISEDNLVNQQVVLDVFYDNQALDLQILACSAKDFDKVMCLKDSSKGLGIPCECYKSEDIGEKVFLSYDDLNNYKRRQSQTSENINTK